MDVDGRFFGIFSTMCRLALTDARAIAKEASKLVTIVISTCQTPYLHGHAMHSQRHRVDLAHVTSPSWRHVCFLDPSSPHLPEYRRSVFMCPSGIEDLKAKRDEVNERILDKQEEKLKIQNDLHALTERLARVTDDLAKMVRERDDYESASPSSLLLNRDDVNVALYACMWLHEAQLLPRSHGDSLEFFVFTNDVFAAHARNPIALLDCVG